MPPTYAFGYERVSTAKQAGQGISLGQQRDAIQRFCADQGLVLRDVFQDADVSGGMKFAKRPGAALLLARARADGVAVIVSTVVDRMFRNVRDGLECMDETFPRLGLRALLCYELLDLSTAAGRFNAVSRLNQAEFERNLIRERATRTNTALRESGRVYGGVPYGCRRVEARDFGTTTAGGVADGRAHGEYLVRDPKLWARRDSIVGYAAHYSLSEISQLLRSANVPAPNGGRRWSKSTLKNLLDTHSALLHLPMAAQPATEGAETS